MRDAKVDDPFAPVTVVVRSNYEGVALRRQLAQQHADPAGPEQTRRGLVAVEFWILQRVADELGSADLRSQGRQPVNDLVIAAAIRQELSEAPGMFADIADHAATEVSLARAFDEVRSLRRDQRERLGTSDSARVREVARFIQRVWGRLEAQNYYDPNGLLEYVVGLLSGLTESEAERRRQRLGRIVLHLPRDLSPNEIRLVQALAGATDIVVHLGVTGNPVADRPAHDLHAALSATGSDSTASQLVAEAGLDETTADRIISVTDPDEEVRTAVRSVLEDLGDGIPANKIAVLIPARDPYARSLADQLEAAGIAWNGNAAQSLSESVVGRFVLSLMRLVVDQRLRRVDVMAMLAEAPVWRPMLTADGTRSRAPVPAAAWERLARAANVVEGSDWIPSESQNARSGDPATRLGRYMRLLDAQIATEESDPEASDARLARLQADRERCGDLAEFISDLSQHISRAVSLRSWEDLSAWLRRQVTAFLGRTTDDDWAPGLPAGTTGAHRPDDISDGGPSQPRGAGLSDAQTRWDVERAAAQRIDHIVEGLSTLGTIEPAADASLLLRTLQSQLASPHGLSGRVGAGVFVGRIGSHPAISRQRLYILGLAEGIYPNRQLPDSLIGDGDRHRGALRTRSERTDAQHRDLLAALACCIGRSIVTIPRGDLRRTAENVPSRWLLPTVQQLAAAAEQPSDDFSGGYLDAENLTSAAASGSIGGLSVSHSFLSGLLHARFPATAAEFDSRDLLNAAAGGDRGSHWLFADEAEPAFARGVALWRGRQSHRFTRFDGNLGDVVIAGDGFTQVLSASRLETWATCPRKYLFSYLLGIDEVVEPESVVRLSPIDRGRLIHESLDELLRELIDKAPTPDDVPGARRSYSSADRDRLLEIGAAKAAEFEAAGATGFPLLWSFDRETVLADLVEVLVRDEQRSVMPHAAARGTVVASEHRFGLGPSSLGDGTNAAVPYDLEPGRVLHFRGAIDRVELIDDSAASSSPGERGRLVVIDYKSGSERPYVGIRVPTTRASRGDDPTLRGTKLQLGVYALAAAHHYAPDTAVTEAVREAAYWFVSARAGWAWVSRPMDQQYFERFDEVVKSVTDGIDSGVFVGYVRAGDDRAGFTPCPYCDPDGIGTGDISRQWKRKRADSGLAGFVGLAEAPLSEGT